MDYSAIDAILQIINEDCLTSDEKKMLESLCLSSSGNTICDNISIVLYILSYRGNACLAKDALYLQNLADCNDCKINVDEVLNGSNPTIYAIGGKAREHKGCCYVR